jgi:AraC-like DNA-binding protein
MKTLIQKIHVEAHHSFACRTYRTPDFETAWHKHTECELILITEGNGTVLIGDWIGEYTAGDVFFISPNLPHMFRKSGQETIGSAIVIHFIRDFWGETFLSLPEMAFLSRQLAKKDTAIQLQGTLLADIGPLIGSMEDAEGIERIHLLLRCMQMISTSAEQKVVTIAFDSIGNGEENSLIEQIIDYSFKHYLSPISLRDVAGITSMSIPSFCRFFKKNIKKSFFDFIREIRIAHACKLLRETSGPVLDICYNSGYNSWAHFSKQFKTVTQLSPTQYRKQHTKS